MVNVIHLAAAEISCIYGAEDDVFVVSLGADVNAPCDDDKNTVLYHCRENVASLKLLHELGANLSAPCHHSGETIAYFAKDELMLDALANLGMDLSQTCDKEGNTPLWFAAEPTEDDKTGARLRVLAKHLGAAKLHDPCCASGTTVAFHCRDSSEFLELLHSLEE